MTAAKLHPEVLAMNRIAGILGKLTIPGQRRVLQWAMDVAHTTGHGTERVTDEAEETLRAQRPLFTEGVGL